MGRCAAIAAWPAAVAFIGGLLWAATRASAPQLGAGAGRNTVCCDGTDAACLACRAGGVAVSEWCRLQPFTQGCPSASDSPAEQSTQRQAAAQPLAETSRPPTAVAASAATHGLSGCVWPPGASRAFCDAQRWLAERQALGCANTTLQTVVRVGRGGGFGSMFQRVATLALEVIGEGGAAAPAGHFKAYTRNRRCAVFARAAQESTGAAAGDSKAPPRSSQAARHDGGACFFEPALPCGADQKAPSVDALRRRGRESQRQPLRGFSAVVDRSVPGAFRAHGRGFWWGAVQAYLFRLNPRMRQRVAAVKGELGVGPRGADVAAHIRLGDKLHDGASRQQKRRGAPPSGEAEVKERMARYTREIAKLVEAARPVAKSSDGVVVYVATDSASAANEMRRWASGHRGVRVVSRSTQTQNISGAGVEIAKTLSAMDDAYGPAEEVVVDLALMAEARFFVGICMSQLARIVVGVGKAAGTLDRAVAMDPQNIALRDNMKLGADEGWEAAAAL